MLKQFAAAWATPAIGFALALVALFFSWKLALLIVAVTIVAFVVQVIMLGRRALRTAKSGFNSFTEMSSNYNGQAYAAQQAQNYEKAKSFETESAYQRSQREADEAREAARRRFNEQQAAATSQATDDVIRTLTTPVYTPPVDTSRDCDPTPIYSSPSHTSHDSGHSSGGYSSYSDSGSSSSSSSSSSSDSGSSGGGGGGCD